MSVESGIPSPSESVPKTRIVGSSEVFPSVSVPLSLISLTSFCLSWDISPEALTNLIESSLTYKSLKKFVEYQR